MFCFLLTLHKYKHCTKNPEATQITAFNSDIPSESTTNPDYNMLRSMEYPTASEKPCFTVNYGSSLPESLSAGEIYLFKNADSGKYMDVQNGTDANDTNVIQWGWNGSAAQQFKLELSSTGNGYILRSQVGGKTRVLDIYKTNGRVENGNNVQIYTNIDPKAQEWLILPVDATKFRIVPRSNPALSLTSYGSSNGTADGQNHYLSRQCLRQHL